MIEPATGAAVKVRVTQSAMAAEEGGSARSTRASLRRRIPQLLPLSEFGVVVPLVALVVLFYLINPAFLSTENMLAIVGAMSFVGIVGVGQSLLLVSGEFDLSVGSVAGLSAVVAAWLMTKGHIPVGIALLGGLATGAGVGVINGLIVVKVGIPAFITTLGMLYIALGVDYLITDGYPIYPLPSVIGQLGEPIVARGVSWAVVLLVVLVIVAEVFLRRTTWGRNLYAIGGNKEVARLVGINVALYKISCFALVGLLSAVAGILVMAYVDSGASTIGTDWALVVIAGVVIGGVSLFGGVGTVLAGILGMLLLQVVQSGLVVSGVSTHWQVVSVGLIMIAAVGVDLYRRRLSGGIAGRLLRRRQIQAAAPILDRRSEQ